MNFKSSVSADHSFSGVVRMEVLILIARVHTVSSRRAPIRGLLTRIHAGVAARPGYCMSGWQQRRGGVPDSSTAYIDISGTVRSGNPEVTFIRDVENTVY